MLTVRPKADIKDWRGIKKSEWGPYTGGTSRTGAPGAGGPRGGSASPVRKGGLSAMFGAHPGVNTDKIHSRNLCPFIGPGKLPRPPLRGFNFKISWISMWLCSIGTHEFDRDSGFLHALTLTQKLDS